MGEVADFEISAITQFQYSYHDGGVEGERKSRKMKLRVE